MKDQVLGICGGHGKMARWFSQHFHSEFKSILPYDLDSHLSIEEFVRSCDLLLVSVPISRTVQVIHELGPFLRPEQLLMDFTSLKEAPCYAMQKWPCHSIGLHPLFGPKVQNVEDYKVVICELSKGLWTEKIKALFERKKIGTLEMDPKTHDQKMALIQALNHGLHLMYGKVLGEGDVQEVVELQTPSLAIFIKGLCNIVKNDPHLYRDLAFENPYFLDHLKSFKKVVDQYVEIVKYRDTEAFISLFNELKNQFLPKS